MRLPLLPASRRAQRAFTLIELLVVIVILGILMAVAIPTFLRQQQKAQDSKTQQQLTTAYKAIRSGLSEFNNSYPSVASVVSVIAQSEPELTVTSGSCNASASDKQVVVDNVTSSAGKLSLYAKSSSGAWWNLSAPAAGAAVFTKLGTCAGPLSTAAVTVNGNEITDATRSADVKGDGLAADSSYGIWTGATNEYTNGGAESGIGAWHNRGAAGGCTSVTVSRTTNERKFGAASVETDVSGCVNPGGGVRTGLFPTVNGATYTYSAWVKAPAGMQIQLFSFYLTSPVYTSTGTWMRVQATGVVSSTSDEASVVTAGTSINGTFYVDGFQAEESATATPYIETNGSTASRGAGLAQFPATALSASQGWYAVRVRLNFPSSQTNAINSARLPIVWWMAPGQASYIWIFGDINYLGFQVYGSSIYSSAQQTISWNSGDIFTLIGYWSSSNVGFSVNGGSFTTSPLGGAASGLQSTMNVGSLGSGRWCDCDILWFADGTGTLSNADAATINGWGNQDPTTQDFPAAAQAVLAWSADTTTYVTGN